MPSTEYSHKKDIGVSHDKKVVGSWIDLFQYWRKSIGYTISSVLYDTFCWEIFKLITDHKPLEVNLSITEIPTTASARICRWALFEGFRLWWHSSETPENSTCRCPEPSPFSKFWTRWAWSHERVQWSKRCNLQSIFSNWTQNRIFNVPSDVPGVRKCIISDKWSDCSQQVLPFKKLAYFLTVENDIVYNGRRPIIPPTLQPMVIKSTHGIHSVVIATRNVIKLTSLWPERAAILTSAWKLAPNVTNFELVWTKPTEFGPKLNRGTNYAIIQQVGNVLIMADAQSGWTEAFICGDWPTEKGMQCLLPGFPRFGVPHSLVSDNAEKPTNGETRHSLENRECFQVRHMI